MSRALRSKPGSSRSAPPRLSTDAPAITYVLAVHDSAAHLESNVERLAGRLRAFPSAEIVLVENGSEDCSLALMHDVALRCAGSTLTIRTASVERGFGNALRRGLALSRGALVVTSGADLPFGFSDLDAWLQVASPPALVLGSKSHSRSHVAVAPSRRAMSAAFAMARRLLLGLDPGDTQGSLLIEGALARRIQPHLVCSDYLITTEIVAWAVHLGAVTLAIPVDYPDPGTSTISPLRDGARMLAGMLALRHRLRQHAGVPARRPVAMGAP